MQVRALQVINVHAQLRAEVDTTDILIDEVRVDHVGPPEWHSGLKHCIAVLEASLPGSILGCIATSRDRESHRVAQN